MFVFQVRGGYSEAARYLLSKGADVTIVTETGDSALSVAGSPNMRRMIRGRQWGGGSAWSGSGEAGSAWSRSMALPAMCV